MSTRLLLFAAFTLFAAPAAHAGPGPLPAEWLQPRQARPAYALTGSAAMDARRRTEPSGPWVRATRHLGNKVVVDTFVR
jgi:hypothetical protein